MRMSDRSAISLIVPLFNVEDYIEACVLSLKSQSFSDFDVVIVNDGSTDASATVARAAVEGDARFTIVDQDNHGPGPGGGRNGGLAHTGSERLMFLDSDDALAPHALEHIMQAFEHDPALDLVTTSAARLCGASLRPSHFHDVSHPRAEATTSAAQSPWLMFDSTPWNKAFRRDFFDRVVGTWPERQLYEDIAPMTRALLNADQVAVLTQAHYLWRVRGEGSITHAQKSVRGDLAQLEQLALARTDVVATGNDSLLSWFDWKTLTQDLLWMIKKLPTVSSPDQHQLFVALRDALVPVDATLVQATQTPLRKILDCVLDNHLAATKTQILRHRLALRQDRRTPSQAVAEPDRTMALQRFRADDQQLVLWVTSAEVDLRSSTLQLHTDAPWADDQRDQPVATVRCERATRATAEFRLPARQVPAGLQNGFVEITDRAGVRRELTRSLASAVKRRLGGADAISADVQLFVDDARIRITRGVPSPRIIWSETGAEQLELGVQASGLDQLSPDMSAWLTCPGSNEAIPAGWYRASDGDFRIVISHEQLRRLPSDALAISISRDTNPAVPVAVGVRASISFDTESGLRGRVSSGQFGQAELQVTNDVKDRIRAFAKDLRGLV